MSASVRIEDEAFSDERYADLAEHLGLPDADCARGKMARIWRQCTIETRYALDVRTIERILGPNGVDALVKSRLGEVKRDGSVRICGTEGRVEWLDRLRKNGKHGGKGGRPKKTHQGFGNGTLVGVENKTPPAPAPAPAPAPTKKERRVAADAAPSAEPSEHQRVIACFTDEFLKAYGSRPTWDAKRGSQVKTLLSKAKADEICRRIGIMFGHERSFPPPPYDLDTFVLHFDKFVEAPRSQGRLGIDRPGPALERLS